MLSTVPQRVRSRKEVWYRYVVVVSIPNEELGDNIQTVAEDAFRLAAMSFDCDFPDVPVNVLADIVAPYKGYHHYQQEFFNSLQISQVSVFDVESGTLQSSEHRPDLPASAVRFHSLVGSVKRDNYLKFRRSVSAFDTACGEVAGLSFDVVDARKAHPLADLQPLEHPVGLCAVSPAGVVNPEVLLDADVVADAVVVQPSDPLLPDKLAVSEQAVDTVRTEKVDITLQQGNPFKGVGVPALGQHGEHQWVGDPFVGDGQHEYVDVGLAELPVCTVDKQHLLPFGGQERVQETGDEVVAEVKFRKKNVGFAANTNPTWRESRNSAPTRYSTRF